jgi:hypothetical protein
MLIIIQRPLKVRMPGNHVISARDSSKSSIIGIYKLKESSE